MHRCKYSSNLSVTEPSIVTMHLYVSLAVEMRRATCLPVFSAVAYLPQVVTVWLILHFPLRSISEAAGHGTAILNRDTAFSIRSPFGVSFDGSAIDLQLRIALKDSKCTCHGRKFHANRFSISFGLEKFAENCYKTFVEWWDRKFRYRRCIYLISSIF